LLDVDLLVQIAVEKGGLDIHLLDLPVLGGSECEERFIAYRLYYGGEGLIIVEPLLLFEAPDDPSGLVAEDLAMRAALEPKDPLAPEYLSASGTAYQFLYLIFF
jgi:hypothetical protein